MTKKNIPKINKPLKDRKLSLETKKRVLGCYGKLMIGNVVRFPNRKKSDLDQQRCTAEEYCEYQLIFFSLIAF